MGGERLAFAGKEVGAGNRVRRRGCLLGVPEFPEYGLVGEGGQTPRALVEFSLSLLDGDDRLHVGHQACVTRA